MKLKINSTKPTTKTKQSLEKVLVMKDNINGLQNDDYIVSFREKWYNIQYFYKKRIL